MTQSLRWVFRLIFVVVGFELAIVAGTVGGCLTVKECDSDTKDGIERTMNSLATKAFALYAAEKAGVAGGKKKEGEECPTCGS
tara:strand:+ start:447 stop:695 length:249 start_codon:yes stop_codon:yes gene_type:complete